MLLQLDETRRAYLDTVLNKFDEESEKLEEERSSPPGPSPPRRGEKVIQRVGLT